MASLAVIVGKTVAQELADRKARRAEARRQHLDRQMTIKGHPKVEFERPRGQAPMQVTICGGCEGNRPTVNDGGDPRLAATSSIMFFSDGRWLCTRCRNEGRIYKQFAVSNPAKRR